MERAVIQALMFRSWRHIVRNRRDEAACATPEGAALRPKPRWFKQEVAMKFRLKAAVVLMTLTA